MTHDRQKRRLKTPSRSTTFTLVLSSYHSVLFVIAAATIASAQNWSGCVVPGINPVVVKNSKTTICIVVSSGDDWGTIQIPYQRWVWTPVADQFSVYTVPNSYRDYVMNSNNVMLPYVSVHTQSNTTLSFIRRWYDNDPGRKLIFPYLTMIVDVFDGQISGIAWDDGCVFCSKSVGSRCMEDTFNFNATPALQNNSTYTKGINEPTKGCWLLKEECDKTYNAASGTNPLCDLKIYVTWTGTDRNGKRLTSADNRFSAFPTDQVQKTVMALFEGAKNTVDDVTDVVNDVGEAVGG